MAQAVDELVSRFGHIHTNNLGLPGNWTTTLETMKLLEGHRGHLTHIQFHSYGGAAEDEASFCSNVGPLAEYVNAHPNITVDVGQVVFGRTTSMTAEGRSATTSQALQDQMVQVPTPSWRRAAASSRSSTRTRA